MWDRALTTRGVPFYVSHDTGTTQWEHPDLLRTSQQFANLDRIEYTAYRTAAKLRSIQKTIYVLLLDLSNVQDFFQLNDYRNALSPMGLERLLIQLYSYQKRKGPSKFNHELAAELTLNWLILLLDNDRNGLLHACDVKTIIVLLCRGGFAQKSRYLFNLYKNKSDVLTMESCRRFLRICLTIPQQLNETIAFSDINIDHAIEQFITMNKSSDKATASEFDQWMIQEPQILVWFSTLQRLIVSENIRHESKCNICKTYPIVGFRYRCLKCFNMDICQSTQQEDIKDFGKILKHKIFLGKTHQNTRKQRYLASQKDATNGRMNDIKNTPRSPVKSDTQTRLDRTASFSISFNDSSYTDGIDEYLQSLHPSQNKMTTNSRANTTQLSDDQAFEIEKVMASLENDNRALERDIRRLQEEQYEAQQQRRLEQNQNRKRIQELQNGKEKLFAKQEILEDHNRQLEIQLQKLKMILQQVHEEKELSRARNSGI